MSFTDILLGVIALLSLLLFGASKDKKASKADARANKAEAEARKAKTQSIIDRGSVDAIDKAVRGEAAVETSKQSELGKIKEAVKSNDDQEKQTEKADKETEEQKIFDMAAEQVARTSSRAADLSGSDRL